jgi:propanol-preferring alcohol dehydrogenase
VCRTDLHLAEGDLAPKHRLSVPGHEVVGRVDAIGAGATRFELDQRVGIAWLRWTCGRCRWCRAGRENLCVAPRFTGWDADGGYAEWAVVDEAYAYELPDRFDDVHAAPLLCAGIIGYRAWRRAALPPAGRLGIYGFGASAHLTAQIALAHGATVHVLTRSEDARRLALELGAHSAGPADGAPPEPLDSSILFAPAGTLVPVALEALDRGGTLAVAGIHLSDIPLSTTNATCSRSASCAASRPTPVATARSSSPSPPTSASSWRPRSTRWPRPIRRSPTSPPTGSTAPPSWSPTPPTPADLDALSLRFETLRAQKRS